MTRGGQLEIDFAARQRRETAADARFRAFHEANPQVYATLARLARHALARGCTRLGVKALWERMRWELTVETSDPDFKLNNNYHSRYARLLMRQEPDLRGLFETRELRS